MLIIMKTKISTATFKAKRRDHATKAGRIQSVANPAAGVRNGLQET